jgi:putative serine protease PepD
VLPSTVTIRVTTGTGGGLGSGFVLDGHGRIMTNNHVVADAAGTGSIQVSFADGHRAKAVLLGRSPGYDLAVIQVDDRRDLHPVVLGDSAATRVGEPAIAIGSPLGLTGTVTEGIISAVNRPVEVGDADSPDGPAYLNALQTDAPINRGNSGGPLVNGRGEVIGVNSAILTGSDRSHDDGNIGIGFAIPIDQAREIGRLLIAHGHASYPVINATVASDGGDDGVTLSTVTPGGAADRAGLRAADVVTAIDGVPVTQAQDLIVAIRNHRPGDTVTLQYRRNGHSGSVQVKLAGQRG